MPKHWNPSQKGTKIQHNRTANANHPRDNGGFALAIEAIVIILTSIISHEWKKALDRIWDAKTNGKVTGKEKTNRPTKKKNVAGKAEIEKMKDPNYMFQCQFSEAKSLRQGGFGRRTVH